MSDGVGATTSYQLQSSRADGVVSRRKIVKHRGFGVGVQQVLQAPLITLAGTGKPV